MRGNKISTEDTEGHGLSEHESVESDESGVEEKTADRADFADKEGGSGNEISTEDTEGHGLSEHEAVESDESGGKEKTADRADFADKEGKM